MVEGIVPRVLSDPDGRFCVWNGDCRVVLSRLPDNCVDAVVTDPPYELGFMGKSWDSSGVAYDGLLWGEVLRVLKPGGHLLAFGGSRTYHRLACAVEDAGFEIRDQIMWVYGSGFPKSLNVSKAIDKAAGVKREVVGIRKVSPSDLGQASGWNALDTSSGRYEYTAATTDAAKQWDGWGTALKPAHEPIVVARKPFTGTVAQNVLELGTGAINIDGTRITLAEGDTSHAGNRTATFGTQQTQSGGDGSGGWEQAESRWPANFIHDGSDEATEPLREAARFFYCAKPSKAERNAGTNGNTHPTVKPITLMRYLCRLVTPPGGTVLDPFTGSGTTLAAALLEGFHAWGCEMTDDYLPIIEGRMAWAINETGNPTLF